MSLRRFTRKDLRLEGGGCREEWPAGHVDSRSVAHLLQTDVARSVETPLCPYISPSMGEDSIKHTLLVVLHLQRFGLVVIA
jgi:hypothetical protein